MMNINMFKHAQLYTTNPNLKGNETKIILRVHSLFLVEVGMTWTGILYFTVCVLLKL